MRIVLSGPPSVGKTTQGRFLAEWLGVPHISSGNLIRTGAAHGNPRAVRLEAIVRDGSLAPSDEIIRLVLERLEEWDCSQGFILDGFPRKHQEAEALLARHPSLDAFVVLRACADVLMNRVTERARQSTFLRPDDDPSVFPRRIATYESETATVAEVMKSHDIPVVAVDAERSSDKVSAGLKRHIQLFRVSVVEAEPSHPAFAF